ncbi:PREDICTED: uncharacterized protein LOC109162418 [Ipomoea nil]|uniref:uncharacterized protein LOC109162418 n=1 Tax=Ipomoea nil TaxID=35883 RepID=UPI000901D80D|nr:PREDICTED: uncharacterized protein LOC109162418 [Ipomoea nil]
MSTISWNCRGLGNPQTVREVVDMVSRKKPDFVYLMETKVDRSHAERLRVKIGFEGLFYVDLVRGGGGLALLWKKNNTARLLSYSKNYVDVEVAIRERIWRMTCFYGYPQRHRRREAWQLLSGLRDKSTLPWVALGDFNDLFCGLVQLPMRGHQFTWEKGKGTDKWMEERLDKVLASARWTTLNTEAWVENILTRKSDHSALFLNTEVMRGRRYGGPRRFRFEMAWVHDDGCRGVVEIAWRDGRDKGLLICQQHCGGRLMRWGGEHWHKFGDRIKQLRKEQDEIRHRRDSAALAEFREIEERLLQLEMQEDVFWRQRAKQHWLRGADCNTKFYHRYASARRKKNYIPRLKDDLGAWVEGDNMKKVVLEYYTAIFTSSSTECEDPMLENFAPRVTNEQNIMLLRQFDLEEVKSALFAMFPDKAPGPDGSLPEGLNDTNVVLIPKKDVPETVADMRPIALSNVLYRIMAKKAVWKKGWAALKLDMAKAYDRMEWQFLRRMLEWGCNTNKGVTAGRSFVPVFISHMCGRVVYIAAESTNDGFANNGEAEVIKQCLRRYEELSGQKVNYRKSSIYFSRNTSVEDREEVANCLQVDQAPNFGKYLGLPSFVGRNKKAVFSYIEDKIKQRITSWNKKFLTQAGKEILLKSVAQSMPTFSMSVFLIPDSAWRLLTSPDTLVAKVYKARYYPNTTFVDAKVGGNPSHTWRSIMAAHHMVVARVRRRIGDGKTTLIWGHPWLPDNPSPLIQTDMPEELRHAKVADLFEEQDVDRILRIPVSPGYEDSWYWPGDPNGIYTVKNAYKHFMGVYEPPPGSFEKWTKIWGMKIPPKWKTFLWRAIGDILPTTNNLIIKRVDVDPTCQMCGLEHENVMHTFINCDYSRHVWNISGLPITNIVGNSFPEWLTIVLTMFTEDQSAAVVALLYCLWRCRNSAVWDGTQPRPMAVWRQATAALQSYRQNGTRGTTTPPVATAETGATTAPRCYVDAGYRDDTGEATYGIVLLSPEGSFIAAKNGRLPNSLSPFMVEALACKEALSWLLEKSITTVTIETDCLQAD